MLFHSVAEEHLVVLSYSDLSVWCYACNDYIDNQVQCAEKKKEKRDEKSKFSVTCFWILDEEFVSG